MTTTRKTIPVAEVLTVANGMLRDSTDDVRQGREAVAILLADVLMSTGNYKGFRYIGAGNEAGAIDDTRRQYYRSNLD